MGCASWQHYCSYSLNAGRVGAHHVVVLSFSHLYPDELFQYEFLSIHLLVRCPPSPILLCAHPTLWEIPLFFFSNDFVFVSFLFFWKIADFGFAASGRDNMMCSSIVGSRTYMAPEVLGRRFGQYQNYDGTLVSRARGKQKKIVFYNNKCNFFLCCRLLLYHTWKYIIVMMKKTSLVEQCSNRLIRSKLSTHRVGLILCTYRYYRIYRVLFLKRAN